MDHAASPQTHSLPPGTPVRINAGAFAGTVGRLVKVLHAEQRVRVRANVFGREITIEAESGWLEHAAPG